MTKQIEDYPELDRWLDDEEMTADNFNYTEHVLPRYKVEEKLLEMAQRIEELESKL